MTPKEKRDAKNARHKRNEQRRRKRWFERLWLKTRTNGPYATVADLMNALMSSGWEQFPDRSESTRQN